MKQLFKVFIAILAFASLTSFQDTEVQPIPIVKGNPAYVVNEFYNHLVNFEFKHLGQYVYIDDQLDYGMKKSKVEKEANERLQRRYESAPRIKSFSIKDESVKNNNALVQVLIKYHNGEFGEETYTLRKDHSGEWKICFDHGASFNPDESAAKTTETVTTVKRIITTYDEDGNVISREEEIVNE